MEFPSAVRSEADAPLRAEHFSAERLAEHARELAKQHRIGKRRANRSSATKRFEENRVFIAEAYKTVAQSARDGEPIAPNAEWLIDNYHVVEDQLREIREDLPHRFYNELPQLVDGPHAGLPRVFDIAFELIAHTDSSLDETMLIHFIAAYQQEAILTSGELWAFPAMLRLVLVENLRRLCGDILSARRCRNDVRKLLDNWPSNGEAGSVTECLRRFPTLILHFVDCTRESNDVRFSACLRELEKRLEDEGGTVDTLIRGEHQHVAANQVSIGNVITSMCLLAALDWTRFFERVSLVESVLRTDPAGIYAGMDKATRDDYRHQVERMAKRTKLPEVEIAQRAVELAERSTSNAPRRQHVGCYLIAEGTADLERLVQYRPTVRERLARVVRRQATFVYVGMIATLTAAIAVGVGWTAIAAGLSQAWGWFLGILALAPASTVAVALVNFLLTKLIRPRALPKLHFDSEIPEGLHTLVVVPSMLTSNHGITTLLERLEMHYLANPERGLSFALLTDFADAPQAEMPGDAALFEKAKRGIELLNARYATGQDIFYLLHRARRWNESEQVWMGWERKRGKLVELNRLLRGAGDTSFDSIVGDLRGLPRIEFVITLDADTRLPHAVARRLVGTIAHPLNRARFDAAAGRVTAGYGVIQPRVSVTLSSARRSVFARLFTNTPGLDPYATPVSDVYQDLFDEGSFTGKGIYDIDAFSKAVDWSFAENHILSHDLIEGCHARSGFVSDVEVFDDFPSRYDADARRQHRWARGDWQLLPWLGPTVPTARGWRRNPISLLGRWKVFDNLRRTLVPASLLLFLIVAWSTNATLSAAAIVFAICVAGAPALVQTAGLLLGWPRGIDWRQQVRESVIGIVNTAAQCGLLFAFLPYRAYLMCDAVARTLWRLLVSKRRLLEWETADAAERRLSAAGFACLREMWFAPVLAGATAFLLPREGLLIAWPVLLLWFASPVIAERLSRSVRRSDGSLTSSDRQMLRQIARKTWAFFERFVTAEDNYLPPDNFQEFPKGKVAHRTSPTNLGLFIVSAIAARDFRFISVTRLAEMLEMNLAELEKLERSHGHFLNWFDTTTLTPLPPRYVSTADSGNMAGCLLTAKESLRAMLHEPVFDERTMDGVLDTLATVQEALGRLRPGGTQSRGTAFVELDAALQQVGELGTRHPVDLFEWRRRLNEMSAALAIALERLEDCRKSMGVVPTELDAKLRTLVSHAEGLKGDLDLASPWLAVWEDPVSDLPSTELAAIIALREYLARPRSLWDIAKMSDEAAKLIAECRAAYREQSDRQSPDLETRLGRTAELISHGAASATALAKRFVALADRYEEFALEMDFTLLYNDQRRLFTVGYNLDEGVADRAHYDLLASEARLASLLAIAKGDADHRHWFQLGRTLTETAGERALLSWGGTMFEFLMPRLFVQDIPDALLDQSCRAAVRRQIEYGAQRSVPWGISESAFAAFGVNSDYHYQSFGTPGLGLKRGLANDLVISPYSTALAAIIDPVAAAQNFRRLTAEGGEGAWGYFDALDYTPDRVPAGQRNAVVACYMAHHHGMTMMALANCLMQGIMQRRFASHPLARSTELLLQERVPVAVLQFQPHADEVSVVSLLPDVVGPVSRRLSTAATAAPRSHLLSNGQYSVMLTNAGSGYSICNGVSVTRWRSDATRDDWGQFLYVRDMATGDVWSAGFQPTCKDADSYEVTYALDKVDFRRCDGDLETHLEITVSPEHNAEIRRITITNHGSRPATVELTSFAEVALAAARADLSHPAFSKLFVSTEFWPEHHALAAVRRPRDASQQPTWAVHVLSSRHSEPGNEQYETDRSRFLGRGGAIANPAAMQPGVRLSGTVGPVLDPAFSLRQQLTIAPDGSAGLAFTTALAASREDAVLLADQYHDPRVVERTFELAWARSHVELRHLHVPPEAAQLYQRLASEVIFPNAAHRAPAATIARNRLGQSGLWRHGVSGDDPIVLVRLSRPLHRSLLREVLLAHEFWHLHGLKADLVVVNDNAAGYFDAMHEQLREVVQTTVRMPIDKSGGVHLLRGAHLQEEDHLLLNAAAAVILEGDRGSLSQQFRNLPTPQRRVAFDVPRKSQIRPTTSPRLPSQQTPPPDNTDLAFPCAYGGFAADGREYVVRLSGNKWTPAPWSNVVANDNFGFLVTESGGGYTWAENSRENKLTSWSNDPVGDAPGEAIYLRDEEMGTLWCPTPLPIRDAAPYEIRHGQGYSTFSHRANAIPSELRLTIAPKDRVKFAILRLRNADSRRRTISATYFAELVLGVSRDQTSLHTFTSIDPTTGAVLARNRYSADHPNQVVFLRVLGRRATHTGDRAAFIGRNGSLAAPDGLRYADLSNTVGAGLDPCAAVQTKVTLQPNEEAEIVFLFGQCGDEAELPALLERFGQPTQVQQAAAGTAEFWENTLNKVQVKTPSKRLDLLVNRWLLYQVLSCRIWGRSAFYQSGGAYGFRDQLQDSMAMVAHLPEITRAQIVRSAARQFEEGDAQHWWHPPEGRGVRTRCSDDYLWLPFVVCHYLESTGDATILDEFAPYLHAAPLDAHEDERYDVPQVSSVRESIYDHCVRAIEHGLTFGPHGLPLIGNGDWNDGMNKVGHDGKGESVWMGWFLSVVLRRFAAVAERRGDSQRAIRYRRTAADLIATTSDVAWDGAWFRRAYFDDGTPLGSAQNDACQIDSLAQTWSVIAGGDSERSRQAMRSLDELLVRREDRIVLLLAPPFDETKLDPGYIKGYLPGIRENGGQYTHAATWIVQAWALLGEGNKAFEVFDLVNPVGHAEYDVGKYRAEPYVAAADVYGRAPHVGRGGWTWYTGSAAWLYRVAVESILGVTLRGDRLIVRPTIPVAWESFSVTLWHGSSTFQVEVTNPRHVQSGVAEAWLDGVLLDGKTALDGLIPLVDDGKSHEIRIVMG